MLTIPSESSAELFSVELLDCGGFRRFPSELNWEEESGENRRNPKPPQRPNVDPAQRTAYDHGNSPYASDGVAAQVPLMTPSRATPFRCCRRGAIRSSVLGGVFAVTLAIGLFWLGTAGMSVRAQSNDGAEPSPLKARELPPDGVLQQLISFDPAGSYDHQCQLSDLGLADVSVGRRDPCIIEVTDSLDVFVDGFDHRLPIAYRITRSDGVVEEFSVGNEPGSVGSAWVAIPGEPFGVYGVRATQRGRSVSGTFEVKPKTEPSVVFCVEHPFRCRGPFQPGVPIILYLAGYAPQSPTPLYLYRKVRDGEPGESPDCPITGCTIYEFASVGPAVVTDERGEAMVRLPTAAGDEGSYLLRSVPPIEPDWTARFAIGDPSP